MKVCIYLFVGLTQPACRVHLQENEGRPLTLLDLLGYIYTFMYIYVYIYIYIYVYEYIYI